MSTVDLTDTLLRDRYRLLRPLGRGGSATTYAADDLETGRPVAVKVLDLQKLGAWKQLDLFEREARTLRALVHPAIPQYLDAFQLDDGGAPRFYLIQALAPGRTLADLVAAGFHPDEAEVRRIAEQILGVLRYLQSRLPPVVHRDIKPQNILRTDDGTIHLVDFGAVNDVRREADGSTVVGTYGYMAPEQLRGQATSASDLYGLGATLVFLLTHRSPAELPQRKLKIDITGHARLSPAFARWLDKLLEPAPEDRFPTAREASLALERGLPEPRSSRPVVLALAGAVTLIALAGGGLALARARAKHDALQAQGSSASASAIRPTRTLAAHWSAVFTVAFSPDGKTLATGSNDKTVKLWATDTGEPVRDLPVTGARVASLAYTRDGASLLAATGNAVLVYDAAAGTLTRTLAGHGAPVTSVAVDAANQTLASGSLDGTVRTWDRATGAPRQTFRHGGRVLTVAWSSDNKTLASAGSDGTVKLWDAASGALLRTLAHGAPISTVAFAPDGQTLVSAGDDRTAKVWVADPGTLVHTLQGHADEVWCASVQPDGRSVATSGKDGTVRLWDLYSGAVRTTFPADGKGVLSIATSPNGAFLATGGGGGVVKLWSLGSDDEERDTDVEERAGWTPLHVAAWDGDLAAVKTELAKGTPVDVRNVLQRTPLYNAAKHGHREVAAFLIERGAEVDARAEREFTPLYVAAQNGHREVVELLIAKGADVRHKNWFGQSYLYKAAEMGHPDIVKIFVDKGLPLNEGDKWRWTPLTIACRRGHARVVELLLAQPGIDLSVASGKGAHTPLMIAAESGHEEVVRQLLDKGADVNARAPSGDTARSLAETYRQPRIAALLRDRGAR